MRLCLVAFGVLLVTQAGAQPRGVTVGIEMRNVRLHVAADAILDIKWLSGRLRSAAAGNRPSSMTSARS